jgi:predicted dehydrogenase/threonine dehydrogenase-like Zn-dependent dehydrogenase
MKQVLQSLKDGNIEVAEVPAPGARRGSLLIRTSRTLVSSGTERMLLEFGKAGWIKKARQQPEKVRMVLDKVRSDGLLATLEAVQSKLDQPIAPGYCNVGTVLEVGDGTTGFSVGDRVVSNGRHAELVSVPQNLCARVPDGVTDEQASFTVLAAIGLQGIRLANPTLGECVVVTGLGLVGLLTVQMLRAQGCRVMGVDMNPARLEMAGRFGAEAVANAAHDDVLAIAHAFSRGRGVDAVIVAAATSSSEPMSQAARMCRKRGRIVLVGVAGLELSRADFYEKELTFQVSCSYGPGRYDPSYEDRGNDYPVGFVRWTEQRNFEAVLDLMASGRIDVSPLVTHRFPLDRAVDAYEILAGDSQALGIVLEYPPEEAGDAGGRRRETLVELPRISAGAGRRTEGSAPRVAFLGAGNYAGRTLIPAFAKSGASLRSVVSSGGVSAVHHGRKHGFEQAATDASSVYEDPTVDAVVVATRHDIHHDQVVRALRSGKSVFCEKPLCLTLGELSEIEAAARESRNESRKGPILMVGFNRRFAPQVQRIKSLLATVVEPKSFVMVVNAGAIPADHWTQDRKVGGGRIVGEGCHFVDLLRYLAGAPIQEWRVMKLGAHPALEVRDDKATIMIRFVDGSVGVVHYLANGHKGFPKERLEVFSGGRVLQLDNFLKLRGWGWPGFTRMNLWRQDKGQLACAKAFVDAVRGGSESPIPIEEILEVSRVCIEMQNALGEQG